MQSLLIYELGNKIILKTLMIKISHISWRGTTKAFTEIIFYAKFWCSINNHFLCKPDLLNRLESRLFLIKITLHSL